MTTKVVGQGVGRCGLGGGAVAGGVGKPHRVVAQDSGVAALGPDQLSVRSRMIMLYALCGFANFASIGLLVSTIGTLAPERRRDARALGVKSWLAGNLATAMTGAVIGIVGA